MNSLVSFPSPARGDGRNSRDHASRKPASADEVVHDTELVRKFNSGDEAAFLEIMARYREKTFAIARSLLRNHGDAEEITQDTFVRAYHGLGGFRGDSSLSTWLHRIALNLARNRYWHFYRRRRHATISLDSPLSEDSSLSFIDLVADGDPDPARVAVSDEFSDLVHACMEKLPLCQREILTLRNILHYSYEEIAASLGITVGTVKSRVARARRNVRALLAEMCPEFGSEARLGEWLETARPASFSAVAVA